MRFYIDVLERKERLADAISKIFAPSVITAFTFVTLAIYLENKILMKFISAFTGVLFSAVLPTAFLYYLLSKGKVTHIFVPLREQRTIPYLFAALSSLAGFFILLYFGANWFITAVEWCYFFNTFLILLINTRWKISAHMSGLSGALTALLLALGYKAFPLFVLIPIVAWSRIELKAHTPSQVIAGTVFGICATFLQIFLFYKINFG